MAHSFIDRAQAVQSIVFDAGGKLVGRTRLQKIAYILEVMECGFGFDFAYKHYGPYSETLSLATQFASSARLISEEEQIANWGGRYSVFHVSNAHPAQSDDPLISRRRQIVQCTSHADAVELEIAATAILLFHEGFSDPWAETKKRKPSKTSDSVVSGAKSLIAKLRGLDNDEKLSAIPA